MDLAEAERRADLAERRVTQAREEYADARAEQIHAQAGLRVARRNAGLCVDCGKPDHNGHAK